jgi:hypothetical protein
MAAGLLPEPLKGKAMAAIADPECEEAYTPAEAKIQPRQGPVHEAWLNDFRVFYQPDGSVRIMPGGCEEMPLTFGVPEYQEVGQNVYKNLAGRFLCNMDENKGWAVPDYCKPGLESSDTPINSVTHKPVMDMAMQIINGALCWKGTYSSSPVALAGCPEACEVTLHPLAEGKLLLTAKLLDKHANRKPEALSLQISFYTSAAVLLQKIGTWISPELVVEGGNGRCHSVQCIRVTGQDGGCWLLEPLDTPLVALGSPDLLDFSRPGKFDRLYLALYNNLWGTNFKMWYDGNILCRVLITYEGRTVL